MTTKEQTCEERIAAQMKGREEYLAALYKIQDSGKGGTVDGEEIDADDAYDRVAELPLFPWKSSARAPDRHLHRRAGGLHHGRAGREPRFSRASPITSRTGSTTPSGTFPEDSPLWRLAEYYAEIV